MPGTHFAAGTGTVLTPPPLSPTLSAKPDPSAFGTTTLHAATAISSACGQEVLFYSRGSPKHGKCTDGYHGVCRRDGSNEVSAAMATTWYATTSTAICTPCPTSSCTRAYHFLHPCNRCTPHLSHDHRPHRLVAAPTPMHTPPLASIAAHVRRPAPVTTIVQMLPPTTTALNVMRPAASVFPIALWFRCPHLRPLCSTSCAQPPLFFPQRFGSDAPTRVHCAQPPAPNRLCFIITL